MANITFIGLGNMGGPMAANLIQAKHQVTVFDLVPEAVAELTALGAQSADTALAAIKQADVVISMLPAGKHVTQLYLGTDEQPGLISTLSADTLIIDSSTIDTNSVQQVHDALQEKGISFLDAPVSGGVAGAKAGTLTFIVGGDSEAFAQAKPVLETMGKNIFHAGGSGSGQVAKICNNMLLSILMAGTSEALQLGIKNGLDPKVLSDIMLQSSGRNWTLELYNPCPDVLPNVPSSNDYQGGFMVDLMVKDLGLAIANAQQNQVTTALGATAQQLYQLWQKQNQGQLDFSSIFQFIGGPQDETQR